MSKRRSEAHLECPVQWASPLCLLSSNPLSPQWHRVESCRHPERASDTFSLFDKMKFYGARDEDEENCRRQDNNASRGQKLKQSGYEFSVSTKTMPGQEIRRERERERQRRRRQRAMPCPLCSLGLVLVPRQIKQTNKQTKSSRSSNQSRQRQRRRQPERGRGGAGQMFRIIE